MQYILAVAKNRTIYAMHDKIYMNEKQARNALKVMVNNKKLSEDFEVFGIGNWDLLKMEGK